MYLLASAVDGCTPARDWPSTKLELHDAMTVPMARSEVAYLRGVGVLPRSFTFTVACPPVSLVVRPAITRHRVTCPGLGTGSKSSVQSLDCVGLRSA